MSFFSLLCYQSSFRFICFCVIFLSFVLPEFLSFHLLLCHFSLCCATRVPFVSFAFVSFFSRSSCQSFLLFICFCLIFLSFLLPEFLTFHLLLSYFSQFLATRVSYISFAFVSFFSFLLPEFLTFHLCLCHFSLSLPLSEFLFFHSFHAPDIRCFHQ